MKLVTALPTTFLLAFIAHSCGAQTPVPLPISGNLGTMAGTPQPNAYVSVLLENCTGGQPQITGYTNIVPPSYNFVADTNGNINGAVWSNDQITCSGTTGATIYALSLYDPNNNQIGQTQCFQVIHTQVNWNVNTQSTVACGTTPPNPTNGTFGNLNSTGFFQGANGAFSGTLTVGTLVTSGSFSPAPGSTLQTTINTAGANSDISLSCGTYTAASGLTIPSAHVHLHGNSRDCTFINFTSAAGLSVSGANVEIDGITLEGLTQWTVAATPTATGFRFHDNAVTQAGQGSTTFPITALWLQAGIADVQVDRNNFYGNGPATFAGANARGYTILVSGQVNGLSANVRIRNNHIWNNNNAISISCFDCSADTQITGNNVNQGNVWDGSEGSGYGIMLYSEGYELVTTSLARAANTVTIVVPAQPLDEPYSVGETVMLTGYGFGTNGTSFNGVFKLLTVSGAGPYTLTWSQIAADDAVTAGALAGIIQPPLQHEIVSTNIVTNCGGSCVYFQGVSDLTASSNEVSQCDMTVVPVSLPHSCFGINGMWHGSISGNSADTSGNSSAYSLVHAYGVALSGNVGVNALKDGLRLLDTYDLAVAGNTFANNADGGIVGASTSAINSFHSVFGANDIYLAPNTDGYHFAGLDQQDNVTGGSVHAPPSGTANAGFFALSTTQDIHVTGLEVDCYTDGSTTRSINYGLRSAGTRIAMKSNPINGCALDGIFDAGTNDDAEQNNITGSVTGVGATTSTGLTLKDNWLAGNTTAKLIGGAVNLVDTGNVTAVGTFPAYQAASLAFSDGSSFTTATTAGTVYQWGSNAGTLSEHDLNAAAGRQKLYAMLSGGLARWSMSSESGAESGADAGSDFCLRAYHDDGTTIDCTIQTVRAASGLMTLSRPLRAPALEGAGTYCLQISPTGDISNTGAACGGGGGGGVASINGTPGAYTFAGAGVSCTGTNCTFSGTGSGVTSVGLTTPSWLTVAGSPVTGAGTLAVTATGAQTANQVLATPNGSTGAVGLRALVAADIPALTSIQIPAQYKIKPCSVSMGDGVNAIPANTYPIGWQCVNDYGVNVTVTGVLCVSDNNGTSTGNIFTSSSLGSGGTGLLTSAITAQNTWQSGTQSGTTTIVPGAWANWSIVADGVTKQIQCRMKGTY